ncbi:hypothetical protein, partial [Parapedobacter sp.]
GRGHPKIIAERIGLACGGSNRTRPMRQRDATEQASLDLFTAHVCFSGVHELPSVGLGYFFIKKKVTRPRGMERRESGKKKAHRVAERNNVKR